MPVSTIGSLPQYQVLMALSANPATMTTLANRLVAASINRGRADELGAMQAGTMTIVLDNADGAFSPDNASSTYNGYIVPNRLVQLQAKFLAGAAWTTLYTGYTDTIRPTDNGPLDSNVTITCVDWLAKMQNKAVTGTASAAAGVHDLVNYFGSIMALIDATATYTIVNPNDGTSQTLYDYVATNTTAGQILTDFGTAVHGVVFAGRDGTIRATANGGVATTDTFGTVFTFDQPGLNPANTVVPYVSIDYDLTPQYLYNDITVTATGTTEGAQNAHDNASITAYDKRSLSISSAIMGQNQALPLAYTLMLAYRNPKPRVHALVLDADAVSGVNSGGVNALDRLFALELTSRVSVTKTNPGSLGINRSMSVEGIKHDIQPNLARHTITLQMTEVTNIAPTTWTLGTSALGSTTILAYRKPVFNPLSISGCTLYLRSDVGVVQAGAKVSKWLDQSGNARDATAGASLPSFGTTSTMPQIGFFGITTPMAFPSSPLGQNFTAFFAYQQNGSNYDGQLFLDSNAGGTVYRKIINGEGGFSGFGAHMSDGTHTVDVQQSTATAPSGTNPAIGILTSAAGQPAISYVNGSVGLSASAAAPLATPTNTIYQLGSSTSANNGFALYAVIIYNTVLSATDRNYVRDGLNTLIAVY